MNEHTEIVKLQLKIAKKNLAAAAAEIARAESCIADAETRKESLLDECSPGCVYVDQVRIHLNNSADHVSAASCAVARSKCEL